MADELQVLRSRTGLLRVLEGVGELRRHLEGLERQALMDARRLRISPTDIAAALGITRQGVHAKLKRLAPPPERSGEDRMTIPELEPETH